MDPLVIGLVLLAIVAATVGLAWTARALLVEYRRVQGDPAARSRPRKAEETNVVAPTAEPATDASADLGKQASDSESQAGTVADQVRSLLETMFQAIEKAGGETIVWGALDRALGWLAEKQRGYQGDAYFDQIENNAVFLREAALACMHATSEFLREGQPVLDTDEEVSFFTHAQRTIARDAASSHLNFIRDGCLGCSVHDKHESYEGYYAMRREAARPDYLEKLEFRYVHGHVMLIASQHLLAEALSNPEYAGVAEQLSSDEVEEIIADTVRIRTAHWGGLTDSTFSDEAAELAELAENRSWRQVWGERFDAIAQTI